jgi:fluoroquinolone transport system permease protein
MRYGILSEGAGTRFRNLLGWDLRFQARYGFYLLYGFLTTFYTMVLFALPSSWKEKTAAILIFSDPAAMGLFFMGAIVLLEKSQKVTSYFAITPLKASEYVWSKVFSLSAISLVVATTLAIIAGCRTLMPAAGGEGTTSAMASASDMSHMALLPLLAGTFLASVIFTLCGIIVATKISSLNQFILATVPIEIIGFVPAGLHLFGVGASFSGAGMRVLAAAFRIYPACVCMDLVMGRMPSAVGLLVTVATIALLAWVAKRSVQKMWQEQGGVKL